MAQNNRKVLLGGVHPAVISVWAAMIAAAHLLPTIVLVGVGGTLSVSSCLYPLAGIFFGPVAGGLCVGIGSFIGKLLAPSSAWLGMFTFLIPIPTAVTAGLICRSKKGGLAGIGLVIVGMLLWYSQEIGRKAWIFGAVIGGSGILTGIIGLFISRKCLLHKNPVAKSVGIFFASYTGMIVTHLVSDFLNLVLFKSPAITWKLLTFTVPVERITFCLASAIIGTPLLIGLPKIGVFIGPKDPKAEQEESDAAEEAV